MKIFPGIKLGSTRIKAAATADRSPAYGGYNQ